MSPALLSGLAPHQILSVRPAIEAALRAPQLRLAPELQTLSDLKMAPIRLRVIRCWLALLAIFDALMLRSDAMSGPAAFHAGQVMRLQIILPLAVVLWLALPHVPERCRTPLFAAFNLVLLTTICIQCHFAPPGLGIHHLVAAGLLIASFNILVPDSMMRATQFTVLAGLLFLVLTAAPIGPYAIGEWDMIVMVTAVAAATLWVRYRMDGAAREAFLLSLQDGMQTQDILLANQMLVDQSNTDPLTRVANRRCFDRRLATHWRPGAAPPLLGLLIVDVDYFKNYNDYYGHPAGDRCLNSIAQAMSGELRHDQDLVARYGGEEFAVLLPGLTLEQVEQVGERLRQRIEAMALPHAGRHDGPRCVTVSIGAITTVEAGTSPEAFISIADQALYEAKRDGRNRLRSGLDLPPAGSARGALQAGPVMALSQTAILAEDLRRALLGGHLHLHYQPLYDTNDGNIAAVEVLLRWTHPQRGSIAPSDFIAAAEESGMIVPVGQWVLRHACAEAASWTMPALLAVNISPVQVSDPAIVATIAGILAETGLAPSRLMLEITEGRVLDASDGVRDTLQRLRALGVGIALDDFGTGYANLSRLRELPFDVVKIDRSFLDDTPQGRPLLSVLTPMVAFARAYAPRIVMEGVETPAQMAVVKALACDWVQGFLLSKPMPAEALRPLLRAAASANAVTLV